MDYASDIGPGLQSAETITQTFYFIKKAFLLGWFFFHEIFLIVDITVLVFVLVCDTGDEHGILAAKRYGLVLQIFS